MSNPAVTKLVRGEFDKMSFWMDDNVGESIHIHLGNFRLDLTKNELYTLNTELSSTITKLVNVDNFKCDDFDPVFISRMLSPFLSHLVSIKIDYVNVGDLIVAYDTKRGFTKYVNIKKGRAIKALNGDSSENNDNRGSHHIGQTSSERLDDMFNSILEHSYPYNNQYIVLFGDQMLVRDGQHRASCILKQSGNIVIPVLRMYFDNEDLIKYQVSKTKQMLARIKSASILKIIKKIFKFMIKPLSLAKNKIVFSRTKKQTELIQNLFIKNK